MKVIVGKVSNLERFENNYYQNTLKLNSILKKLQDEKTDTVLNCKSLSELARNLFINILKFKEIKIQTTKFVQSFQYSENSIYKGPVDKNNKSYGAGTLYLTKDNRRFNGEFENGTIKNNLGFSVNQWETYTFRKIKNEQFEGIGLTLSEVPKLFEKRYYYGESSNYQINGKGKYVDSDGEYYEGEWKNGKREGKGKNVYSDGGYYEGEWKNDNEEGKGKNVYPYGGYYEGEWKNGNGEGRGKKVLPNGEYFEGEYKNNKAEGKGKFVKPNGEYIEGRYKGGMLEGKAKLVKSNGSYFLGECVKGNQNGKGKYYVMNLGSLVEIQEGQWIQSWRQGKFCITDSNNQRFYRTYKDDHLISY